MRLRDRKKAIDRQSLFNIHFAQFIVELNQTLEEAYKSLDEVIDAAESENNDEDLRDTSPGDTTEGPPGNP